MAERARVLQTSIAKLSAVCTTLHILIQFSSPQRMKASPSLRFTDFSQRRHNIFCYSFFNQNQCYRNPALSTSVQPPRASLKPHDFVLAPKCRPVSFTSSIKGALFHETESRGTTSICTAQDLHAAAGKYSNGPDVPRNFMIVCITHRQETISSNNILLGYHTVQDHELISMRSARKRK
jgi:hypothetical protein